MDGKRGFRRGSSYILLNVGGADTGQLEGEGRYTGIRCPLAVPPACPAPPDRPASQKSRRELLRSTQEWFIWAAPLVATQQLMTTDGGLRVD